MLRKSPAPPPHTKTLDEQQSDFTAEGSPPPGKVGNNLPAASIAAPDAIERSQLDGTLTRNNIRTSRKPLPAPAPAVNSAPGSSASGKAGTEADGIRRQPPK